MWKGYESKSTLEMNVNEIFSDFQCWYDNCSLVGKSGVNFLVIVRCDEFFQKKTSCYILLSVCIVFSDRSFFFFFFSSPTFDIFPWKEFICMSYT